MDGIHDLGGKRGFAGENPQHCYTVDFDSRELWGPRRGAVQPVDRPLRAHE
jgi:Nitrile hydratase beta subunit